MKRAYLSFSAGVVATSFAFVWYLRSRPGSETSISLADCVQVSGSANLQRSLSEQERAHEVDTASANRSDQLQSVAEYDFSSQLEAEVDAMLRGDVDQVVSSILLEGKAATIADDLFHSLPVDLQTQYRSADRLVASVFAGAADFRDLHIVDLRQESAEFATGRIEFIVKSDGSTRSENLTLKKQGGAWRRVISPEVVARIAEGLTK